MRRLNLQFMMKREKIYDDQISIAEMQSGLYYTIPVKKS